MQVFHKHADVALHWKYRRMWPVFVESALSILWALCFVSLTVIWGLSYAIGMPPVGASPIPNLWGMTIGTLCLLQLAMGALIDRRYDRSILRFYPYAVWYPIIPRPEAHGLPRRLKTIAQQAGRGWLHATLNVGAAVDGTGLSASGMFIINPPHTLKASLDDALPQVLQALSEGRGRGAEWSVEAGAA